MEIKRLLPLLFGISSIVGCNKIDRLVFGKKRPDHKDLRPCDEFLAELSDDYERGFVSVPEDWDNPASNKIDIFYYIYKGGDSSDQDNVVFFNGGPTGDSHSSYSAMEDLVNQRSLDFVYIDQRGTGCSTHYPEAVTYGDISRYAKWGSRAIVKDAEAVREQIFGEGSKWKIFGQSYGSLIAHRYWEIAPQSVVSTHAHGFAIMADYHQWTKERILNQKVAGDEFAKRYPTAKINLSTIKENLTGEDCLVSGSSKICDDAIMDMFFDYLGWTEHWSDFDDFLSDFAFALKTGNKAIKDKVLSRLASSKSSDSPNAGIAGAVISTMEISGTKYSKDSALDNCPKILEELRAEGHDDSEWMFNECRRNVSWKSIDDSSDDDLSLRSALDTFVPHDPVSLDGLKESFNQHKDSTFYLYSGKFDAYVPPATFKEEVDALGSLIQYKEFETTAHGGFYRENEVWDNLEK